MENKNENIKRIRYMEERGSRRMRGRSIRGGGGGGRRRRS